MNIILADEEPVYQQPKRLPIPEQREVERQIQEWLKDGIVTPSCSDYASSIVLVKKENTTEKRVCVDFVKLNKMVKDRYPFEDQLNKLSGAKVFTTLSLKNVFFHVPIEPSSRKYTSFVTPSGQFEFLKAPFGLCNSPAVFQRFINDIFQDLIRKNMMMTYLDDIVIPSKTEEEGMEKLKTVLRQAEENGLTKKCQFLTNKIDIIENNTVKPLESKIAAVIKFPVPSNVKQIQSFLGLTGYFRKFIENYSLIAKHSEIYLKRIQNSFLESSKK